MEIKFQNSWADTIAQARREHGPVGAAIAHLLRAEEAGSKAVIGSHIGEATRALPDTHPAHAFTAYDVLEWTNQPYSQIGLQAAATTLRQALEAELAGVTQ
jgi:hypothetical protein